MKAATAPAGLLMQIFLLWLFSETLTHFLHKGNLLETEKKMPMFKNELKINDKNTSAHQGPYDIKHAVALKNRVEKRFPRAAAPLCFRLSISGQHHESS